MHSGLIALIARVERFSKLLQTRFMLYGAFNFVDTSRASIARVYDVGLGGKDNFEVDRAVLRQILEVMPEFNTMAEQNRDWLIRVVRFLAREAGINQFLDAPSGTPASARCATAAGTASASSSATGSWSNPA